MRKKTSTRGTTRDPVEMKELVRACIAAISAEAGGRPFESSEQRAVLVSRLRDQHGCTLEQIGEAVELSAERVRQLYQGARREAARRAREARAPVEELSPRARQGLTDVGIAPEASMQDVVKLLPILRLAARPSHEHRFNAHFHAHLVDHVTMREIEEWLRRHGVVVR